MTEATDISTVGRIEKVRAETASTFKSLVVSPLRDFSLVARQKDIGDFPTLIVGGAGIYRGSEEIVLKRIGESRLLVAEHTGNQAHDSIDDAGSREFAASEDIIAN